MPDTALLNALIVLPDQSRLQGAIGITEGRVSILGSDAVVRGHCGPDTTIIDLNGACVLPGFIDSHLHLLMAAQYLSNIGLRDARSLTEVVGRVAAFADAHPDRAWLIGHEWSYGYPDLPETGFDCALIDAVVPDRPVFLASGMAHAAWANSAALQAAGIDASTPDPEGGEIVRRPDGTPSGWLKEEAAKLVQACVPPMSAEQRRTGMMLALKDIARCGITRVESAAYDEELLPLLSELERAGELTCRIGMMSEMRPPAFSEDRLAEIRSLRAQYNTSFLRLDGIKFFLDGVLESHTGYMPRGYADRPDETGTLIWDPALYRTAVSEALRAGFPVWTHAIGSGAIKLALDAYAAEPDASKKLRPRVEHVEIPDADDIPRFAEIGAIASLQPVMVASSDEWMGMEGVWAQRVRPEDLPCAFPMRSLLNAGAAMAFGTDWPIVSLSPLRGIRKAVLRRSLEGGPALVPEQAITVREAVEACTSGGAWACLREDSEGCIATGRPADFTILAADPEQTPVECLHELPVLMTVVEGRIVYRNTQTQGSGD
ncbi:amidohydrolase [Acetobacter oeni]|uniref:Amidohydrolase 3 domain-containing protein n=1 Tax=Acetobacter oeni TaxID=304077 RepID=A0A511XPF2_9PROT|nr:amidohydrolase [Acetobacter oeni]MBB3884619.1 hypothetical protein [Acetobacter oeni]NHO20572.1 amidohydrolase family protein [Acetobacter oeni]GBR05059.1 putative metal-dependent hydrolase [Acetobacter oeni LMG 21952]GEN64842.1 hypothetical protein AOE01nite_30660 [Acetobacter oeni]